ncbi:MAG: aminopeptidase P family N-terminal domain-containing protein, partial [Deltaproteobacteria bacterium]|nr:aminopeptidase P family N-terminal domain-containing protein [Deltaproteobacteria bacterium]
MEIPTAPPPGEIESRVRALAARIDGRFDAALISHPTDLQYFAATTQDATLVVRANGDATLLARKSFSRARAESPLADVRELRSLRGIAAIARIRAGTLKAAS